MVRAKGFVNLSLLLLAGVMALAGTLVWAPGEGRSAVSAAGPSASCWKATLTQQWTNLELAGSVLRVYVQGKPWLPVEVRSPGDFKTVGYTNTKPEYGPFVAEFAPLSRGTYYIEPKGLGVVFEVWLDGRNYTRVDFTPQPCAPTPTATPHLPPPTPRPKATATPLPPVPTQPPRPTTSWYGRVVQHEKNPKGVYWATLAVRVIGRPAGQEVVLQSGDWSTAAKIGTKPEYGPDACEFGGLQVGTYRITPTGLGAHLDVSVEHGDFVLVEFYPTGATTARWVGSVVENTSDDQPTEHVNSAITVVVAGKLWHEVEIRSDDWITTAQTGYKPEYGPDACEFGALRAGTYTITPKGLGTSIQVTMDGWGWAMVRFDQTAASQPQPPSPPSQSAAHPTETPSPGQPRPAATPSPSPIPSGPRWRGWVVSNTSGEQLGTGVWSIVIARVLHSPGVPVAITGGGGWTTTCITGTKPEYGYDACEFGGLWPGTYYLRPEGADVQVAVTMDGQGIAFVEFAAP
ncbi:hypothetical protein ACFLYD_00150 [Chloroflexota bacterium]